MNIEKIDTSRILISLCARDMERYEVTFESLNFSEAHSKRVLKEIMAYASEKTGVNFDNKRIMIEALKYESGCLLLLTLSARKKIYRARYYDNSCIFTFGSAENFLSCLRALYHLKKDVFFSTAYLYKDRYYLVIKSSSRLKGKYIGIINEFCDSRKRNGLLDEFLSEHARILKLNDAVQSIGCF